MDINRLTQSSQQALQTAQDRAVRLGHQEVDGEHLLVALLEQADGLVPRLLDRMELDAPGAAPGARARARAPAAASRAAPPRPARSTSRRGCSSCWSRAERRGRAAQGRVRLGRAPAARAARRGQDHRRRPAAGRARRRRATRFLAALQRGARQPAGHQRHPRGRVRGAREVRRRPGRAWRAHGKLDPVIGRDEEIRRVDPHPVAQDQEQPGADRRARRRQDRDRRGPGAAHRRAATCPSGSRTARSSRSTWARCWPAPSTAASSRSASRRCSTRSRRARAASCCSSTSCTPSSAPARTEGATDAGNMLKPMLARGELHCIGATTLDEYRKYIEKDAALERRFQPVLVDAPTRRGHDLDPARPEGALRGAPRRAHPGRRAGRRGRRSRTATSPTASCPTRPSTWSTRPAAMIRTEIDSMPAELDEVTRRVMQLEIEEAALKKEKDKASRERARERCARSWPTCASRPTRMRAQWEAEKEAIERGARAARGDRDSCATRSSEAERDYDLEPRRRAPARAAARSSRQSSSRSEASLAASAGRPAAAARGGHRGRDRRDRRRAGPASRSPGWSRASARSCCGSTRSCTGG